MSPIERFASNSPYEAVVGYSRVVRAGQWFVTAGCTATVNGVLVGIGDPYEQTRAALTIGIQELEKAGCPGQNIVGSKVFLIDREHTEPAGRAHKELLGDIRPALTLMLVGGFVNHQMLVEIELTGYVE